MTMFFIFWMMILAMIGLTGWNWLYFLMIPLVLKAMDEYDKLTEKIIFLLEEKKHEN